MAKLSDAYKTITKDNFPPRMEISFIGEKRQTLSYERVEWDIDGERRGLRYGENPEQEAALYRLTAGNLQLGDVVALEPGRPLVSAVELASSRASTPARPTSPTPIPGSTSSDTWRTLPAPSLSNTTIRAGVAVAPTLFEAYHKAYFADRVAAFGGCVVVNRTLDAETAAMILESYVEVVVAPDFGPGVLDAFKSKPNIRVLQIRDIGQPRELCRRPRGRLQEPHRRRRRCPVVLRSPG